MHGVFLIFAHVFMSRPWTSTYFQEDYTCRRAARSLAMSFVCLKLPMIHNNYVNV